MECTPRFIWAVGLFEGEGHVGSSGNGDFRFSIASSDKDVIGAFWDVIGRVGCISTTQPKYVCKSGKPAKLMYAINLTGQTAMRLALTFWPYLGERRREQIDTGLEFRRQYYEQRRPWGGKRGPRLGTADLCYTRSAFTGSCFDALANPAAAAITRQIAPDEETVATPPSTQDFGVDAALAKLSPIHHCVFCWAPFTPKRVIKRYCSHKCSWNHWNLNNPRVKKKAVSEAAP